MLGLFRPGEDKLVYSGNTSWRERTGKVDLLWLKSLDEMLLYWDLFSFFYKTSYVIAEVNCTELGPVLSFESRPLV